MKQRISEYARELRAGLAGVVRLHPVETALSLVGTVLAIVAIECDWRGLHAVRLALVPLFFAVALALNLFADGGPWRRVYRVAWVPALPLALWTGLHEWVASVSYGLTVGVLLPLLLLLARRAADNRRFASDALLYLRAAVVAALLGNVALGLFEAILWSTAYIFAFTSAGWVQSLSVDTAVATQTLLVPLLFLAQLDLRQQAEVRGSRLAEVLLNRIVTPALIVYAAILYLYMAKILVTWSLPRGGVAYMVFGFALLALVAGAVRPLLDRRPFEPFFRRFSWIALPAAALFWAGVGRRVAEYGLTEMRVYLIACGAVMTAWLVLFLSRRTGRYLYVCALAFVLFAALAYVPQLDPERMAVEQQFGRARRIAGALGRLDAEGRLRLDPVPLADTVRREEYHRLYESVSFLWYSRQDTLRMGQLGLDNPTQLLGIFPAGFADYVRLGYDPDEVEIETIDGSHYYYLPRDMAFATEPAFGRVVFPERNGSCLEGDTIVVRAGGDFEFRIVEAELLRRQLSRVGVASWGAMTQSDDHRAALLDYRDEQCRILFDNIDLRGCDSTGWHVVYASVEAVFLP